MKKVILFLGISLFASVLVAQNDEGTSKTYHFGFLLNAHYSNLKHNNSPIELDKHIGYGFGLLGEMDFSNRYSVRATSSLVFNGGSNNITFTDLSGNIIRTIKHDTYPISIDPSINFLCYLNKNRNGLYIFTGACAKLPINEGDDLLEASLQGNAYCAEIGVGFHQKLDFFGLSPELKYSHNLNGLESDLLSGKYNLHQISFNLIFRG